MNIMQDYPHLSRWPVNLGPAPTHDHLLQAYALLLSKPGARSRGTHKALGVAAYLSGHYWHPKDLGRAIDDAMDKSGGAGNDLRNVIIEKKGRGLKSRGLVTLDQRFDGRRETWSCKLTSKGEAVVRDYCAKQNIENPVAVAREWQTKVIAHETETVTVPDAPTGPTRGPVPSSWSGTVARDAEAAATTYAFRFGKRNVWKIGWAGDVQKRLSDVDQHIPHEVLGERWAIVWQHRWRTQNEACEMEQRLLKRLDAQRTVGERVYCTADELQAAWVECLKYRAPVSTGVPQVSGHTARDR